MTAKWYQHKAILILKFQKRMNRNQVNQPKQGQLAPVKLVIGPENQHTTTNNSSSNSSVAIRESDLHESNRHSSNTQANKQRSEDFKRLFYKMWLMETIYEKSDPYGFSTTYNSLPSSSSSSRSQSPIQERRINDEHLQTTLEDHEAVGAQADEHIRSQQKRTQR
jgi:hypothetical protein